MSHELRTPLNAILGFSNLLRERADDAGQRRDLDIISRSGEHLLTLINEVLDFSKIEAGSIELQIGPCDVRLLVRDVADMLRVRVAEKDLTLHIVESPGFPARIQTDAAKLREVLINLLGNAVKYTDQGSIQVRLDATKAPDSEKALVSIAVRDTGMGIAPQDHERIFKPFEQAAGASRVKGTGLGLAITRHIVEAMGGSIELESAPGQGSCFRVKIPMELAPETEREAAEWEHLVELEEGQPEYRILVVEDEPANWMVMERILRDAGFSVRVAENGKEAIENFIQWRPHFIWMDLQMPHGLDAPRRIRALEGGREVKIAAVTASGLGRDRNEVLAAGLDDYVRKPYLLGEIFACMARHLGARYRVRGKPHNANRDQPLSSAVAALPPELRSELLNAVVSLDARRTTDAIQNVAQHDHVLAAALTNCAKDFSYTTIFQALGAREPAPTIRRTTTGD